MAEPVAGLQPEMTRDEIGVLRECYSKAASLVEFGSGGSTLLAVGSPLQRIWSVESDPAWIAKLRPTLQPLSLAGATKQLRREAPPARYTSLAISAAR